MTLTASFTEAKHPYEFLASEAQFHRSRENVTVLSGQDLLSGHVVGKVSKVYGRAPVVAVTGTGDGVISDIRMGPLGKAGTYTATVTTAATNGGTFTVVDPDGNTIGTLVLTTGGGDTVRFYSDQIDFSITDGSTDFAADDVFSIVVAESAAVAVVGTGNGTISAISLGRKAQRGTYRIVNVSAVTNGGVFAVYAPDGQQVAEMTMTAGAGASTAFVTEHLNFTLTDGSTDFAAGDYFNVAVLDAGGEVVEWDPTPALYDGRHEVAGILIEAVDASGGNAAGVIIARDAEVEKSGLNWITGILAGEKNAAYEQMKSLGIIAR